MRFRAWAASLVAGAFVAAAGAPAAAARFEPEGIVHRPDRVATLALARAGTRLVAAGERGRILVSDDQGATWKLASSPTYHTLTSLAFTDANTGFATGHQGVLLRTEDGARTWNAVRIDAKEKQALFAVNVRGDRGIAVGAFGTFLETRDGGQTWSSRRIGPADFDRHLTGIARFGTGQIILAGEAGTLLLSRDEGATWRVLQSPYEGSFFGAIGLARGGVIAYGMRGNAWRSTDGGASWKRIDLGNYTGALQGASEPGDGSVLLFGADGLVAISRDGGASFTVQPAASRVTIAALMRTVLGWIMASPAGLRLVP